MTILTRTYLRSDWPDELRRMFPRITVSQVEAFGALATSDRLVTDEGAEHPALVQWVAGVVGVQP